MVIRKLTASAAGMLEPDTPVIKTRSEDDRTLWINVRAHVELTCNDKEDNKEIDSMSRQRRCARPWRQQSLAIIMFAAEQLGRSTAALEPDY